MSVNLVISSMLGFRAASVKSAATLIGDDFRRGVGEREGGCKAIGNAEESNPPLAFGWCNACLLARWGLL